MEITRGKIHTAQKVVVYGPEGIGKSTLAAQFPNPLFSDTEGSTKQLDIARFPKPSSWEMLNQQVDYVIANPDICDTYVIDTFDWAEQLCIDALCAKYSKAGIEDFGYGNGYVYEKEDIGRFLNKLEDIIAKGINVVITAHAQLRKFSQPDEIGEYDRWELKLGKKTSSQISPLVKEWADAVLFINYKTVAVATDKDSKKFKAQGGKRVVYTQHHPCWDAKNRWGLPEEIPLDYSIIAPYIYTKNSAAAPVPSPTQTPAPDPAQTPVEKILDKVRKAGIPVEEKISMDGFIPIEKLQIDTSDVPKPLADLMRENGVTKEMLLKVIAQRGHFPADTPFENLPREYIDGVLIAAWQQVFAEVKKLPEYIPF